MLYTGLKDFTMTLNFSVLKQLNRSPIIGIGYKEHGDEWLEQQSQFEKLLAELGSSHGTAAPDKRKESLELRSQQSRARVQ
jgi:hypothetical protein